MRKLKDIATLYAGVITSRVLKAENDSPDEDLKVGVLVPKAITDGKVDLKSVAYEYFKTALESKNQRFLTQSGDIVTKFSSPYESCIIDETSEGLLVPSFCCRIVAKDDVSIDRMFLLAYLNSGVFQEHINRICHGRTIALVRKSDLEEVPIPEIPLDQQYTIGKRYCSFLDFIETTDRIKRLEMERMDAVFTTEEV